MTADGIYGPNSPQVQCLIERAGQLTQKEANALADAWDAAGGKEMNKAVGFMFFATWDDLTESPVDEARWEALNAAGDKTLMATPSVCVLEMSACDALWYAAVALAVRDLLSAWEFEALVWPVAAVLGRCWEAKQ